MNKNDNWPPMRLTKQQYEKMSDEEKKEWVKAMEEKGREILSEERLEEESNEEFFKRVTGLEDAHEAKKKYFQKIAAKTGIGNIEKEKVVFGNAAHMQAGTEYDKKKKILENKKNKVENKREKKEVERILSDSGILEKIISYKDKIERGKENDAAQLLEQIKFNVQESNLSEEEKSKIEKELGISLKFSDEEVERFIKRKFSDKKSLYTEVENRVEAYKNSLGKDNENQAKQEYEQLVKIIETLPTGKIKTELAEKVLKVFKDRNEIGALKFVRDKNGEIVLDKDDNPTLVKDTVLTGDEAERFKNLNEELIWAKRSDRYHRGVVERATELSREILEKDKELKNKLDELKNRIDQKRKEINAAEKDDNEELVIQKENELRKLEKVKRELSVLKNENTIPTSLENQTIQSANSSENQIDRAGKRATTPKSPEQNPTEGSKTEQAPAENGENGTEENVLTPERIRQRIDDLKEDLERVNHFIDEIKEGQVATVFLSDGKEVFRSKEALVLRRQEIIDEINHWETKLKSMDDGDETTPTSPENQSQGQESIENSDQLTLGERINQRIGVLSAQLEKVENALANIQEGEEIELILDGEKQNFTKETLEAKQKELKEKIEILEKRLDLWNEKERVNKNLKNIEKVLKENKGEDLEKKVSVEIDGEEKEMTLAELYRLKGSLEEEKAGLLTQNMDAYNQEKDLEVKGFWGELWNKVSNWKLVKEWQGMSKTRKLWWSFALGTSAATLAFPAATSLSFLAILGKSAGVRAGTMMSAWMGSEAGRVLTDSYIDNGLKKLKKKELELRFKGNIKEADILKKKIEKKEEHKGRWVIAGSIIAGALAGWGGHSLGNSLVGVGSSTPEVKGSQTPIHEASTGVPTTENNTSANIDKEIERAVQHSGVVEQNEGLSQNISAVNEAPAEASKVSSVDNSFLQSKLTPEEQETWNRIQQVNHGIDDIEKMGIIQIQENDWTDLDRIFEKEFSNLSKPERANLVENVLSREGVFDGKNLDMERVSEVLKEPMKGYSNLVMRADGLSIEKQEALMKNFSSLEDEINFRDGVKIDEQEHILNSPVNNDPNWGKEHSVIKEHTFGRSDIHQEVNSLKGGIDKVGHDLNSLKEELRQTTEQLKEAMQASNGDLNITAEEQEKLNILDQAAQEHNLSTGGESILEQASKVYENAAANLLTHPGKTIQVDDNFKVNLTGSGNEIILTATNGSHTEIQNIKVGDSINANSVTEALKKLAIKFAKS